MDKAQITAQAKGEAVRRATALRAFILATGFAETSTVKAQINEIVNDYHRRLSRSGFYPLRPSGLGGTSRSIPVHEIYSVIRSILSGSMVETLH